MSLCDLTATPQNPACGSCQAETEHEGEHYACYPCQLAFDSESLTAEFLNPDDPVCGAPCDSPWHGDSQITLGWGYHCHPCQLPAGHDTSRHWTGCSFYPLPETVTAATTPQPKRGGDGPW